MGKKVPFVTSKTWQFALRTRIFIQVYWGENRGGVTREELARAFSISQEAVRQEITPMILEGYITRENDEGRYNLAQPYSREMFHECCYFEGEAE